MTFLKDKFNQPMKKIILFLRLFCSLTQHEYSSLSHIIGEGSVRNCISLVAVLMLGAGSGLGRKYLHQEPTHNDVIQNYNYKAAFSA
jgi:hypothetical protein